MYVQGKCYKCGGFLAVDESQDASVCPFCNNPFIVQKAIISYKENALPAEEIKMPSYSCDGDFVIERSMLVRYNGYTNKDKYPLDGEAKANADVYNTGDGITANDALTIQKYDAGLVKTLPVAKR